MHTKVLECREDVAVQLVYRSTRRMGNVGST